MQRPGGPPVRDESLRRGADGVLILGCHPGDCHYKEQNYRAVQRHRILLRVLEQFGIPAERCRLGFISAAEGQEYAAAIREMTDQVRALGPLVRRPRGDT